MNSKLSSIKVEHFTPVDIVEAARKVMGRINIDPASCDKANEIVKAEKIYTKDSNGLDKSWNGSVFLNCPGGKIGNQSSTKVWLNKAIEEYQSGRATEILWIGFSIEQLALSEWFFYFPICFCNSNSSSEYVTKGGRIKFIDGNTLQKQSSPTHCSFISYWYDRNKMIEKQRLFASEFSKFGTIIKCNFI